MANSNIIGSNIRMFQLRNGGLNPDLTHSNEIVSAVGYASISEQSGRTQEEKVYGLCEHQARCLS